MQQNARLVYESSELGAAVRRVRREAELSQAELAGRIGLDRMTLSRLERGESGAVDTALRALSECGYALAVVPKFTRVSVEQRHDDESH